MTFAEFLAARLDDKAERYERALRWRSLTSGQRKDFQYLLADNEAKRKILGWLNQWDTVDHLSDLEQDHVDTLTGVVALLAYPFRDHPDWPGKK